MRILHIEDKAVVIQIMQRIAQVTGYDLFVANNGREGLQMLELRPDVILTDLGLPDIQGIDLIRQIQSQLPTVPVIAVTAHVQPTDREQCLAAGCAEFVAKPFRYSEMLALLKRYALSDSASTHL
jgi:CheY-like chemotaxis protein